MMELTSVSSTNHREDGNGNDDDSSHRLLDGSGGADTYTSSSSNSRSSSSSSSSRVGRATSTRLEKETRLQPALPSPAATAASSRRRAPKTATATTRTRQQCSRGTLCVSALVLLLTGVGISVLLLDRWRAHSLHSTLEADLLDSKCSSTIPVSRSEKPGWMQYHNTLKVTAEQKGPGARVLLLGDSITEELLGTSLGSERANWGSTAVWSEYYAPLGGVNLGVSGDQTQHLLWRLQNGELPDALQPESVLVAIGTNNLGNGASAEDTAQGVEAVVKYLREQRPDALVCVMALFPRSDPRHRLSPVPWRVVDEVNDSLRQKLALGLKEDRVRFVDCTDRFLSTQGVTGRRVLNQELILPDFLHLTHEGLGAWADCANATIQSGLTTEN